MKQKQIYFCTLHKFQELEKSRVAEIKREEDHAQERQRRASEQKEEMLRKKKDKLKSMKESLGVEPPAGADTCTVIWRCCASCV